MGNLASPTETVDLSHHINKRSKARHPSPLKDIIKFMNQDGMISLAGGLPHPSLFPLQTVTFECPVPTAAATNESKPRDELLTLRLGRNGPPGDLSLEQFMQYGSGAGNAELAAVVRELTDRLHAPPYRYDCLLHPGNTNAWAKVVGLLCEENDNIIVDEYVYPSAQALWIPMGIKAVPVDADAEGMQADKLEEMLATWDNSGKRGKRPHVVYVVPVGSNPTGLSISKRRRQLLYDVCVKYDMVIVEDDPYYCLQYPPYKSKAANATVDGTVVPLSTDEFVASLIPSFLSIDRQGRVIRLESFSKTLFPALRLGYFIANSVFIERLLRASEVETQDPSGLSQLFVLQLLRQWTIDGYIGWLQTLQSQYCQRRDWLLRAIAENFELMESDTGCTSSTSKEYKACIRDSDGNVKPVFSFVDPTAGMFLWTKFDLRAVSRFSELSSMRDINDPEQAFADELWNAWCSELILVTPGSYYHPWQGPEFTATAARGAEAGTCDFRLSFATPTKEQIEVGVRRLSRVVGRYW